MIETTLLEPSQVIGHGYTMDTLGFCLEYAIRFGSDKRFRYYKIISGMDRSIRVFGHGPFEGSISLPQPLHAQELAIQLVHYIDPPTWALDRARYPIKPADGIVVKGWTISRCAELVDDTGSPLIAAYATWVSP